MRHEAHELTGLPDADRTELVELPDRGAYRLDIGPVRKRIGDAWVRMLAYNGSIPGPTLAIPQGGRVTVEVTNNGDLETTVHWHGIRLENRYDGTHDTQDPIAIGETYRYELEVPDPGAYWYHPHIREDYGQELGLYGTILVRPVDPAYWPPAHRELLLTLDDVLIEDGRIAAFGEETTHVAMGRFGNVMLIAGEADLRLGASRGEVVRFYLTNTANTRIFNVRLPGALMKLVGADSGRYERETLVEEVLISPSERAVIDVLFERPGELMLEHRTPERSYPLARITVTDELAAPPFSARFHHLRTNHDLVAQRKRIARYVDAEPDKTLAFVGEMGLGESVEHGRHEGHGHDEHHGGEHARLDSAQGIEWEDDMVDVNRLTTTANMRWKLVDRDTGAENTAIEWQFRVGDQVKIRLVNELDSDHPMPHPFHVHGAGRFLILARDGAVEPNLVWKDTVLVRTGETVDILLDVTNPGVWMAHCHIAEHDESGMMLSFTVADR
jgi:FtsP/CotA-like multicopper oxidase with cupredoxin domain